MLTAHRTGWLDYVSRPFVIGVAHASSVSSTGCVVSSAAIRSPVAAVLGATQLAYGDRLAAHRHRHERLGLRVREMNAAITRRRPLQVS
jgi:hypothetical protein